MGQVKRLSGARDEILSVNNSRYLAPYQDTDFVLDAPEALSLATVIVIANNKPTQLSDEWFKGIIENYKIQDDVFNEAFLDGLILSGVEDGELEVTSDAQKYLSKLGNRWLKFLPEQPQLLPGPYINVDGQLRDAWLLQDDTSGTLMASLRPQHSKSDLFDTFPLKSVDGHFLSVPLRSRLKAQNVSSSPISGWRILVKDNIDIKGVKTSLGNRAYSDLYPPRAATAQSIQKLIDRGAIVSGKTKLNSFGDWEEPLESIDYQAPFNPRGDGYQSTGGSSSGSAAAVSSYEWIDVAIGTDTWGSVTRPAQWCGCFGLRPTIGAVSTHGVEPYAPTWDTPGALGRDVKKLREFAAQWLDPDFLVADSKPFNSIIWASDFWSIIDHDQVEMARRFVTDMETYLGVHAEDISFVQEWAKSAPPEAHGSSLGEFINQAPSCQGYDAYHNEDDFREQYQVVCGKFPYIGPRIQHSWAAAEKMTKEERDSGYEKIDVYRKWFQETILTGPRSNALVVMPQENMIPRYRDQPPSFRRPPHDGIGAMALAAVLRSPALTVPIDQIQYQSTLSRNPEYLPVVVTLSSSPGTDLFLLQTTQEILEASDRPISVKTGRLMFDVVNGVNGATKSK